MCQCTQRKSLLERRARPKGQKQNVFGRAEAEEEAFCLERAPSFLAQLKTRLSPPLTNCTLRGGTRTASNLEKENVQSHHCGGASMCVGVPILYSACVRHTVSLRCIIKP